MRFYRKVRKLYRRWQYIRRLKYCYKWASHYDADNPISDFFSNVGYEIACGRLPKGVLQRKWEPLHKLIKV